MAKKKSKGVLKTIGNVVATGTEAVIDAGSKVIHAVGEMMPTGKKAPKRAKAKTAKTKAPKAAAKAPKAKVKAKAAPPKAKKPAGKTASGSRAAKPAAKAASGRKK